MVRSRRVFRRGALRVGGSRGGWIALCKGWDHRAYVAFVFVSRLLCQDERCVVVRGGFLGRYYVLC